MALENYYPKIVVGIKRGGLVPAVALSHKLRVPCEVLDWQTRDGFDQIVSDKIRELYEKHTSNILVVDDIVDSGKTLKEVQKQLPKAKFAALVVNTEVVVDGKPAADAVLTGYLIDRQTEDRKSVV